jgi:hypothetical protein
MGNTSFAYASVIIGGYFRWLGSDGWVEGNPLAGPAFFGRVKNTRQLI